MKTTKILGATTLAGALLFTGVNAHAAENVSKSQAEDSVKNLVSHNSNYHPKEGTKYTHTKDEWADSPIDNSYNIAFGEEPNQSPSFLYVKKDTGDIYDHDGNLVQKGSVGSKDINQNNTQQTQGTDNTAAQNNTQAQSKAQTLPETGETSNTTLVTMVAAVMLAAGSLLTFKRFSKDNK